MKTTLNEILKHNPCGQDDDAKYGFNLWCKNTQAGLDDPITLMQILKSNGIKDAIWTLRCFEYKDYCLFLADVAESVLHIYEAEYDNPAPRLVIDGIRDYHAGLISKRELNKLRGDASTAAAWAAAAATPYWAATAATPYRAATWAATATATARENKWDEIEELFVKYFGDDL